MRVKKEGGGVRVVVRFVIFNFILLLWDCAHIFLVNSFKIKLVVVSISVNIFHRYCSPCHVDRWFLILPTFSTYSSFTSQSSPSHHLYHINVANVMIKFLSSLSQAMLQPSLSSSSHRDHCHIRLSPYRHPLQIHFITIHNIIFHIFSTTS